MIFCREVFNVIIVNKFLFDRNTQTHYNFKIKFYMIKFHANVISISCLNSQIGEDKELLSGIDKINIDTKRLFFFFPGILKSLN